MKRLFGEYKKCGCYFLPHIGNRAIKTAIGDRLSDYTTIFHEHKKALAVNYNEFNIFCRALPATSYIVQWGGSHIWKVAGKVFAIGGWEKSDHPAFTFKTSDHNFEVLQEQPGFRPAPYMASRGMKWIQQHDLPASADGELKYYLEESHRIVSLGLTKKKQKELGLNQD